MTEPAQDGAAPGHPDEAEPAGPPPAPTTMLSQEQHLGYGLAVAIAAGALFSQLPGAIDGNGDAAALAALGVGLAAILAATVRYGQRVVTSFAAIIAGYIAIVSLQKSFRGLQLLALVYSGWLMWRTSRAQQKARVAGIRREPRHKKPDAQVRAAESEGARRPEANRRYTPPKAKGQAGRRR